MLTDQAGLFTADPRLDPSARLVPDVTESEIPSALWEAAGGTASGLGTGGMVTKLQAASLARRSGTTVIIASGAESDELLRLAGGEKIGTRIHPIASAVESRKRYILAGGRALGAVRVDAGAEQALHRGRSLLPVGVVAVEETFERGDTIRVTDSGGREIACGIANYGSAELIRICGQQSDAIEATLGYNYGEEVIHRNDLVLL